MHIRHMILQTLLFIGILRAAWGGDVVVDKLKLFVDGEEFFIKAMCYNPVPLGIQLMDKDQGGGGGYCSPKMTVHGEWKSACYDSDYFDGSSDTPDRVPAGPEHWFQAVWERDFPEMQAVGANTLRIYNANPTTRQASLNAANGFNASLGKDHTLFFDMAASYGFHVIFPLFGDYNYLVNTPTEEFKQFLRWQIDEIGNHSALLMYTLGNELDLFGTPSLVALVNEYAAYAREYMSTKWGRSIPITSAIVDLPNSYATLFRDLDVDVFTTNAGYRGFDFSDLWTGNANVPGLYELSCTYDKPVFIGEIGWMSMNGDVNALYPDWVNRVWKDLVNHMDAGCIGGAFFEYSNEPYSKADPLQQHMGIVNFEVDGGSDQLNVFKVDKAVHMPYLYDALASGTYEGVSYNMNSNAFDLAGRDPHTISSAPNVCAAGGFVTPSPKPTSSGSGSTTRAGTTSMTITGTTGSDSTTSSSQTSTTPSPSSSTGGSGSTTQPTADPSETTGSTQSTTPTPSGTSTGASTGDATGTPTTTPTSTPSSTTPSGGDNSESNASSSGSNASSSGGGALSDEETANTAATDKVVSVLFVALMLTAILL